MNEEKMRKEFEYWYRSPVNTDLTSKLAYLSWQAACASKQEEIDNWKIVAEDWRVKAVEWSRKNALEGLK